MGDELSVRAAFDALWVSVSSLMRAGVCEEATECPCSSSGWVCTSVTTPTPSLRGRLSRWPSLAPSEHACAGSMLLAVGHDMNRAAACAFTFFKQASLHHDRSLSFLFCSECWNRFNHTCRMSHRFHCPRTGCRVGTCRHTHTMYVCPTSRLR